ncbi:glutamine ABC transporter, ATP-binding protein [Amylolactobacillus amylotrophicus DSM 20534]|uniref:Glutamine ABC transporter, ATP-binding protein n=3 Tax=Amylolactobacillus TaxID=2767876 RepID=A0A0R1YH46_9LACO|nr:MULTISPECIES: ATP-binding cassette domain-containing protein [Amylolactobacillus]APT18671.1 polar amino acid ABC transporter ATP-binding protein [Amylolactobacillus amylophilus DSM 20533 = JCM 1125]KRK37765.1 glutamine ABC transporter, ATP-binding protein [Amylolactobacillus amylotrophicus DSM 20534]KRM41553.1 glutamine ABC transporter, ATP-binding protein [Amylolactobacillus amylophilus DSM 20533 = JCM 1125]GED80783.1 polar amino acid ABC transporter ATP-binding protein [Amylolactobacillus 
MLELKQITKRSNNKQILKDVSLTARTGETLTIVGPSGAGKTTLLRVLTGLTSFDAGQVLLDGVDVTGELSTKVGGKIGVVFQDFNLFPQYTALENVSLPLKLVLKMSAADAEQKALELLQRLALTEQQNNYPFELSGGQKQRVAIARALALKPEILCYDEPTSALDPALSSSVAELINGLKLDGITQIVVTHDLAFAEQIADQTFTLEPLQ